MKQSKNAQRIEELCQEIRNELGITGEAYFIKRSLHTVMLVKERCDKYKAPYPLVKSILFGQS